MAPIFLDLMIAFVVLASVYGDSRVSTARAVARLAGIVVAVWVMPLTVPGISGQILFYAIDIGQVVADFVAGFLVVFAMVVGMDLLAVSLVSSKRSKGGIGLGSVLGGLRGLSLVLIVLCSSAIVQSASFDQAWRGSWIASRLGNALGVAVGAGIYPPTLEPWLSQVNFDDAGQPFVVDESVIVVPEKGYL